MRLLTKLRHFLNWKHFIYIEKFSMKIIRQNWTGNRIENKNQTNNTEIDFQGVPVLFDCQAHKSNHIFIFNISFTRRWLYREIRTSFFFSSAYECSECVTIWGSLFKDIQRQDLVMRENWHSTYKRLQEWTHWHCIALHCTPDDDIAHNKTRRCQRLSAHLVREWWVKNSQLPTADKQKEQKGYIYDEQIDNI